MPGFVIHLAIAKEYLKKNKEINEEDFLKGVIQPDLVEEKSKSHYGASAAYSNLEKFLENNNIKKNDFVLGEFMHLTTDYIFYNTEKYMPYWPKGGLYDDYDKLNKSLISKYNIGEIPEKIKGYAQYKIGEPINLKESICIDLIEYVSGLDLKEIAKEVINKDPKWTKFIFKEEPQENNTKYNQKVEEGNER